MSEPPVLPFESRAAWARWLAKHYGDEGGVWIRFAKKASGIATVTYDEALKVALCFGWIDGQVKSFDEDWYLQRFTPRRARSKWSQRNVGIATELIGRGAMHPTGLAAVDAAKADGRWEDSYPSPSKIEVPDDLRAALAKNAEAAAAFETLSSQNRYAILYQIHDAKRPDTRARRIAQFTEMLARGETPHP